MVTSVKSLYKTVEASQLTSDLCGTFTYSHSDWLQFHQVLNEQANTPSLVSHSLCDHPPRRPLLRNKSSHQSSRNDSQFADSEVSVASSWLDLNDLYLLSYK